MKCVWQGVAVVLFAVGSSLVLSACPPGTCGAMDPDLVGEWSGTATINGVESGEASFTLDEMRWESRMLGGLSHLGGTYSANTDVLPHEIDLLVEYDIQDGEVVEREVPELWLGLYSVSNNTLTLVHNATMNYRPENFEDAVIRFNGALAR
ncbi:MAG: hypothetical protein IT368_00980 [Candidatus Hydrogenedentes bacterium]|nr:hypothetical protein [Candidatus Hydrogenedentota bacterium]